MEYYRFVIRKYEEKLIELMGEKFHDFARSVAKEGLRQEIEEKAESEFKDFILDNFDDITRL